MSLIKIVTPPHECTPPRLSDRETRRLGAGSVWQCDLPTCGRQFELKSANGKRHWELLSEEKRLTALPRKEIFSPSIPVPLSPPILPPSIAWVSLSDPLPSDILRGPGIYAIQHIVSGRVLVCRAMRVRDRLDTYRWAPSHGTHFSRSLQAAWDASGPSGFRAAVLESLPRGRTGKREFGRFLSSRRRAWQDLFLTRFESRVDPH